MDVGAAIENPLIAATSMGLATFWVGNPNAAQWSAVEALLREALHIPAQRNVRIPALIAVGHPAEERPPHGKEDRFDPTKVHYGLWEESELGGEA
jgi:nitroreductase